MSKSIHTLVYDIHEVLDRGIDHDPSADLATKYAMQVGSHFAKATLPRVKPREKGKMWVSDLSKNCTRKLWYEFNYPECAEPFSGSANFKFLYGNILEEAVLYFAEEAGHTVEHAQARVEVPIPGKEWVVSGRIDAIIDGHLVDVKTCSSYAFSKYKKDGGLNPSNDSWGYTWQLSFYDHAQRMNPTTPYRTTSGETGILWIDKQNGHLMYDHVPSYPQAALENRIETAITHIEFSDVSKIGRIPTEAFGARGNQALSIECSYCQFKKECWKDANGGAGLRGFAYMKGPVFMTEVKDTPRVPELTLT